MSVGTKFDRINQHELLFTIMELSVFEAASGFEDIKEGQSEVGNAAAARRVPWENKFAPTINFCFTRISTQF